MNQAEKLIRELCEKGGVSIYELLPEVDDTGNIVAMKNVHRPLTLQDLLFAMSQRDTNVLNQYAYHDAFQNVLSYGYDMEKLFDQNLQDPQFSEAIIKVLK